MAIPLAVFTPQIYGRPSIQLGDVKFIFDYIASWWQKLFRRIRGHLGPAENVTVDPSSGQRLSQVKPTNNPKTAAEVIRYIQANSGKFSTLILDYLNAYRLPNKSVQLDVLIVPDNLYVTFEWDKTSLKVHDGWRQDLKCDEWIQVTVTADVVMKLWENQTNIDALRSILLAADRNGELTYKLIRVNPITSEAVLWFEMLAAIATILGWTTTISLTLSKRR